MTIQLPVTLNSPIALVPAQKTLERLDDLRLRFPYVPDMSGIHAELCRLAANGGVPARVEDGGRLVVYGENYFLSLYPSKMDDCYTVGYVDRLRCQDHDRLAKGVLRLRPPDWQLFSAFGEVARGGYTTHWQPIQQAWQHLGATTGTQAGQALPAAHAAYLDQVAELVDRTRQLDMAAQQHSPAVPYRAVRATGEQRYTSRGVYLFELAGPARLTKGRLVQVGDDQQWRGKVLRVNGTELTVRFDTAIDFQRLHPQGTLREVPTETVYRKQHQAVSMLREGTSVNAALLPVLVDRGFAAYEPDVTARPVGELDPGQAAAFAKACTVPDVLLVQGPPGTGKSWTIAEIARESAARGQQALVTSYTHRAVDNVLAKLPDELLAVRIGDEDSLTEAAKTKLIDSLAGDLQREILANTEGSASRLATLVENDRIERWLALVGTEVYRAHRGQADVVKATALLAEADERIAGSLIHRVATLDDALLACASAVRRCSEMVDQRRERFEQAEARGRHGILARWQAKRRSTRLTDARQHLADAVTGQHEATTELGAATAGLEALRASQPELTALRESVTGAAGERDAALHAVATAHAEIERLTYGLTSSPAVAEEDLAGWTEYLNWCRLALPPLSARAALLREWRDALGSSREQLYPELVRHADVVAATCVGVATSDLLTELEFDIAIVDEAAQISLPNVLIPLVRARRAVLVGDHMQLPPLVPDELRDEPLLATSAFESLVDEAPESHVVRLETQRRMPSVVADFVSARFYDNWLRTAVHRERHDPRFTSALALVDTSDLPARVRAERGERARQDERSAWQGPGYDNPAEAKLIIALVVGAQRAGTPWAVIVPYQAQVALIRRLLNEQLRAEQLVEDNVGTVDAFQGGERDLIVYGCTRSNGGGHVGFLRELRRFNVAITRAREQLVVVGDLATLTSAEDDGVRELMGALVDHAGAHGQLVRSSALLTGGTGA